jgi:hypothetical protein
MIRCCWKVADRAKCPVAWDLLSEDAARCPLADPAHPIPQLLAQRHDGGVVETELVGLVSIVVNCEPSSADA